MIRIMIIGGKKKIICWCVHIGRVKRVEWRYSFAREAFCVGYTWFMTGSMQSGCMEITSPSFFWEIWITLDRQTVPRISYRPLRGIASQFAHHLKNHSSACIKGTRDFLLFIYLSGWTPTYQDLSLSTT